MLIRRAEVGGRDVRDVRIDGNRIAVIADDLAPRAGETVIDAAGGALLPGLHDHHIHLLALAAAARSLCCGPPKVCDHAQLEHALRALDPRARWMRGVGYHESVAGNLDRAVLDRMVAERPVRIQHRSGAAWFLNSRAIELLQIEHAADAGIERDERGRATGRLYRCDALLRERLREHDGVTANGISATHEDEPVALGETSLRLASYGVTGVTDASAHNGAAEMAIFCDAATGGTLLQKLHVMGTADLPASHARSVTAAALKIVLDERDLPSLEGLAQTIARAHGAGRSVAIHCVTRAEIVLACAALREAGTHAADRIEHAAVAPPEVVDLLRELRVTVVTQPGFVRERGESYLEEVEAADLPWLYRCKGLIDAGVAVGGSTDAPYSDPDPWLAMRAAVDRMTIAGRVLDAAERVAPERALALFTTAADAPGAASRRIAPGCVADLCLLDRTWSRAREELSTSMVRVTLQDGRVTWGR